MPRAAAARHRRRSAPRRRGSRSAAVDLLDLARRVRHTAVRLRRGPSAGAVPRGRGRLRRRRRVRDQGVLCLAMARLALRRGHAPRRGDRRRAARGARRRRPGDRLVLHGNNKSVDELRRAREVGVGRIVVDSFDELDRLDALHGEDGCAPRVLDPRDARRRGPHPRVRTHRSGGLEVRLRLASGAPTRQSSAPAQSPSVELAGVHTHIGSQVFVADFFDQAIEVVAPFARRVTSSTELSIGGGLGVAYVDGEEAPTITQWARSVRDGGADGRHHGTRHRRARAGDRRRRGHHALHGRHGQGAARHPHVRVGRRRHERQPAAGPLRQRLRGLPAPSAVRRPAANGDGRRQALRVRRPCWSATLTCPPISRSATCWRPRSRAPTAIRWDRTTTRCRARQWSSCRDGDARLVVRRESLDDLLHTDLG